MTSEAMSEQDLIDLQYDILLEDCERHVRMHSLASDSWINRATSYLVSAYDDVNEFDRSIAVTALEEFFDLCPETDY